MIEPKHLCIEELRIARPDIAILVTRENDEDYRWDGGGPDPKTYGYFPYVVQVKAIAVRRGTLVEGRSSLGGTYYTSGEIMGDVHGHLPQMVEEAVAELDKALRA